MSRRRANGGWQIALLLAAALILWVIDATGDRPPATGRPDRPSASGGFERFDGCELVAHRQNDGDSFRIRLPDGRTEEFRLYFVDAPESAFRSYGGGRNNHGRIAEQARALGLAAGGDAVEVGKQAKARSLGLLEAGPFTIHTRWDDPFADRRYHAFVAPKGGGWLHETLVREGLARIHTKGSDLPDGTRREAQLGKLRALEAKARGEGRGAWGMGGGGHPRSPH